MLQGAQPAAPARQPAPNALAAPAPASTLAPATDGVAQGQALLSMLQGGALPPSAAAAAAHHQHAPSVPPALLRPGELSSAAPAPQAPPQASPQAPDASAGLKALLGI